MSQIPLGQYAYRRADGLVPSVRLENVFFEQTPSSLKTGFDLLTRPALQPFASVGSGPIRRVFWENDVFGDDALAVSGSQLFRVTQAGSQTLLGDVGGAGYAEIACSTDTALIATGGPLTQTDGATVTPKAFPLDQNVVSVGFINGYFLAVPANSNRIYYLDLVTGEFDEDRFIAAERYPDNLQCIVITSDEIWAMGSASVEVFVPTGVDTDEQPPFQRVEGRLYKKGVVNAATVARADNTVIWCGPAEEGGLAVYRGDAVPVALSDEAISERLSRADPTVIKAWVFGSAKHTFYILAMGAEGTWAFDILTGGWFEWTSYARDQWRAHTGRAAWPGTVLAGDDEIGQLWRLDDRATTDDGQPIVQVLTAGVPVDGRVANQSVSLDCAVGQAINDVAPVINLRVSADQGRTWSDEGSQSIGLIGEYDARVRWNRLGLMQPPARIYEWTTSDPVRMRVSSARINDSF